MVSQITLSAGTIEYEDVGSGEPILLLHGLVLSSSFWDKVVPALSQRHRCLVPTLPLGGHRVPMRRDADLTPPAVADLVAELVRELGLDRPVVVANDTGGAIAQLLVTRHPDVARALVLTPCDAFEHFLPWQFRHLQVLARVPGAAWQTAQLLRSARFRRGPLGLGLLSKHGIPDEVSAEWVRPLQQSSEVRRDLVKVLRGISTRHTLAAAKALPGFDRPALVAWAREDRVFPVSDAVKLVDLMPDARLELLDDSGSYVPLDQPDRLVEAILAFTWELDSRRTPTA